jgi:hypothetical protein
MATVSKFAAYHTAITTGYTNPSNAYADDGVYATAAPAKNAEVSAYFGFPAFTTSDIPDGSIINSVTTEFKYHVSTQSSIATQYWQTFKSTTALGTEQSDATEPLSDVIKTHQVTSGITLTDLRSNDVARMRLRSARGNSSTSVTFYIDYVKITVDYTPAVLGAAVLSGVGSLTAISILIKTGAAILSGIGSLSGIASVIHFASAALSGVGSLVAQGTKTLLGQASLAGEGLLSAIGQVTTISYVYGSAALSGIGQLTATGVKILFGQASLLAGGTLSAAGSLIKTGIATLSGVGSLAASGVKILAGQAILAGQGVLTALGVRTLIGKAELLGGGILSATGRLVTATATAIRNFSHSKFIRFWS